MYRWLRSLQKLWLLPDTRYLFVSNLVLLVIGLAELGYSAARPCIQSERLYSDECDNGVLRMNIVLCIKGAVSSAVVLTASRVRSSYALSTQLGVNREAFERSAPALLGWAAASSEGVFDGVVKVTARSRGELLVTLLLAVILPVGSFLAGDLAAAESAEYQKYLAETCPPTSHQWQPCEIAWRYKLFLATIAAVLHTYPVSATLLLRPETRSPVVVQAVKSKNIRWMSRCMWLHLLGQPAAVITIIICVLLVRISLMEASAAEMTAFTYCFLAFTVYFSALLAYSFDLDGLLLGRIRQAAKNYRGWCRHAQAAVAPCCGDESTAYAMTLSPSAPSNGKLQVSSDSSFKHRQQQLLTAMGPAMVAVPMASWWTVGLVWAFRLACWAVLLNTADRSCTLAELERSEPAFGLLIDAFHLRAIISAYLKSQRYKGPVQHMRATYYRMQDTMTVSYRWSAQETQLCPGFVLNMSDWQLAEVEKAIGRHGCLYVWIDRIAVPQETGDLQKTLLARMMAIYAASKVTLALRTCEGEMSRYHQRAWTLQEYCNARSLDVVTEPLDSSSVEEGCIPVEGDEEEVFPEIRQWHLDRGGRCHPFWLRGFSQDKEDIKCSKERLQKLSARLHCKYPADKIRALYPMLFNTPCEDQEELEGLVAAVQRTQVDSSVQSGTLLQLMEDNMRVLTE